MRKVYITLETEIIVSMDDDADIDDVMSGMSVFSNESSATVENTDVTNYEVTNSK